MLSQDSEGWRKRRPSSCCVELFFCWVSRSRRCRALATMLLCPVSSLCFLWQLADPWLMTMVVSSWTQQLHWWLAAYSPTLLMVTQVAAPLESQFCAGVLGTPPRIYPSGPSDGRVCFQLPVHNPFVYKMAGAISASCPEPSLVKSEGRGRKIWKTGQIEST